MVVCTNLGLADATQLNEVCRQQGVAFIRGEIRGVFGSIFCDFGDAFNVVDVDGEELYGMQTTVVLFTVWETTVCMGVPDLIGHLAPYPVRASNAMVLQARSR